MSDLKKNAKQLPAKFYAKHMQPGIAQYENETILVDTEHMKKMTASGIGKPVYVLHNDVNMETLKEDMHGVISGSFYNQLDGWLWFEFMAIDDLAFQAIANGWAVSNAYIPTETGDGGEWHNCKYDREILNGEFTHLAIVPNPRYEGACIFTPDEFKSYQAALQQNLDELQNSKPAPEGTQKMNPIKIFKNEKKEVATVDAESMLTLKSGKEITFEQALEAYEILNAKEEAEKKQKALLEQVVTTKSGKKITVGELMNAICDLEMENEDDEEEKEGDEKENAEDGEEEKEKENSDEEDEKKNKKMKKNAKESGGKKDHFREMKNAHLDDKTSVRTIETSMDMVARGKAQYGSQKSK